MKIAIIGFGVEGHALSRYFGRKGHELTICDWQKKEKSDFKSAKVHYRFGPHYLDNLQGFDMIFRSPGIPWLKPEFNAVRGKLTSLTRYFFDKCPCSIVGVTGTKGKGTTSTLIYEMLKAGRPGKQNGKIFLGGNIGSPPLDFLDELSPHDIVILELSSFQLQDLNKSPHVAVVLGITPDHFDHHKDFAEYSEAKKNIVRFQKKSDIAIINSDNETTMDFAKVAPAKILHFSTQKPVDKGGFMKVGSLILKNDATGIMIGKTCETGLIGVHNLNNILAAGLAAKELGAPVEAISKAIKSFKGLPHRLEFIREVRGARFYNDSASTNPDTAIAAIRAFKTPIILLLGGSDKNIDFGSLGEEIAKRLNVRTAVLMGETKSKLSSAIENAVRKARTRNVPGRELELISAGSYEEAFMVVKLIANPGDTVLLSPACASFDMFSSYKERGDIFRSFVMDIEDTSK